MLESTFHSVSKVCREFIITITIAITIKSHSVYIETLPVSIALVQPENVSAVDNLTGGAFGKSATSTGWDSFMSFNGIQDLYS
jgi:hypothetical protein